MSMIVRKLTDFHLLASAVQFVFGREVSTSAENRDRWYNSGHSPIRTQLFAVYASDVPYSVCMQMRTHEKNGALFIIEPGRPDTGTERARNPEGNYRNAPRNMFILCNAQHLIDWSHKRLCYTAEDKTRQWFMELCANVYEVDPELAQYLEPMCKYRNGKCTEFKPCGRVK